MAFQFNQLSSVSIKMRSKFFGVVILSVFVWPLITDAKPEIPSTTNSSGSNCQLWNRLMLDTMLEHNNACRCFDNPSFAINSDPFLYSDLEGDEEKTKTVDDQQLSWIGCSRDKMPSIFKALTSLPNETNLSQLWIWDSLIPLIPVAMKSFSKVRPRKLIIERSHLGGFSGNDIFNPLSDRLMELELKNNVLRDLNSDLLSPLKKLVKLDLGINQLTQITGTTFEKALPALRSLSLYRNHLIRIDDNAFDNLRELRSLNLANNQLERITASTFKNLRNLEYLNLENNLISEIDENAFLHLTRLRVLNLGGNRLKKINFPVQLPKLKQLFLNNNSFESFDDIRTTGDDPMPSLETLYLDQNQLKNFDSENKNGLKRWSSLQVLSLASNRLTTLNADDLDGLKNLRTLSLQGNQIMKLETDGNERGPFSNLVNLRELFLSQNKLKELKASVFTGLTELRILTVARNDLSNLNENVFDGLNKLEKLFLNDNGLKYLKNTTFDALQTNLQLIDLSDNPWNCNCELQWLAQWITTNEKSIIVDTTQTQCSDSPNPHFISKSLEEIGEELITNCANGGNSGIRPNGNQFGSGIWNREPISSSNNLWITILGVVLGVVSICILLAVSYLYFQETTKGGGGIWKIGDSNGNGVTSSVFGRWTASGTVLRSEHALRRVPSDMVNLIPKCSNNSSSAASTTGEKM